MSRTIGEYRRMIRTITGYMGWKDRPMIMIDNIMDVPDDMAQGRRGPSGQEAAKKQVLATLN